MSNARTPAGPTTQARRPARSFRAWLAALFSRVPTLDDDDPEPPSLPRASQRAGSQLNRAATPVLGGAESVTTPVTEAGAARPALPTVAAKPPAPAPLANRASDVPATGAGVLAYARFAGLDFLTPVASTEKPPITESQKEEVLAHVFQHKPGPNSFPTLSTRILHLLSRPDEVDISDLVQLVSQDTALSVSVLRAANSAGLRGLSEIHSVRDAITRMGLRDVSEVASAMAARSLFSPKAKAEHAFHRARWVAMFLDASVVAMGAARLAMQTNRGRSDRAFLGGMLHDVGKTMVLKSLAMLHHESKGDYAFTDPEIDALLDSLHVVVGTEIQREWGLPSYLITLCERHHDATLPDEPDMDEVHLVRVASGVRRLGANVPCDPSLIAQIDESLAALRLNAFQFRAFHSDLKEIALRMAGVVGSS
jgi:HD-like signal output (HDOD) protein